MASTNEYSERRHLFSAGDDIRGNLFSKSAYTQGFGAIDMSKEGEGKLLSDIMFAKNYDNKETGMRDNDIHWEFVDMVVKAAYYHRELDKPTETGSALGNVRQEIEEITAQDSTIQGQIHNMMAELLASIPKVVDKLNDPQLEDKLLKTINVAQQRELYLPVQQQYMSGELARLTEIFTQRSKRGSLSTEIKANVQNAISQWFTLTVKDAVATLKKKVSESTPAVSYTHLRAHETL